jgi:hypothetical protein
MLGIAFLIGVMFLLISAPFIYLAIREREEEIQSRKWPSVEGKILHVSANEHVDEGHLTYFSKVVYQYKVGEQVYSNDRVEIGARSGRTQFHLKRWSDCYSAGRSVRVYHDPQNPTQSVLEPYSQSSRLDIFVFAGLLFFSGISSLILSVIASLN